MSSEGAPRPEDVVPTGREGSLLTKRLVGVAGVKGSRLESHSGAISPRDSAIVPALQQANKLRERNSLSPRLPTPAASSLASGRSPRSPRSPPGPRRPHQHRLAPSAAAGPRTGTANSSVRFRGGPSLADYVAASGGAPAAAVDMPLPGSPRLNSLSSLSAEEAAAAAAAAERDEREGHEGEQAGLAPGEAVTRHSLMRVAHQLPTFLETLQQDPLYQENLTKVGVGNPFLYMQQVGDNPYCLRVTEHTDIDHDDYYTMSNAGLTHFSRGESQFQYLEEFEREYYLFALVTQIPFFRRYRLWKQFTEWRMAVCERRIQSSIKALEGELFILHPLLGSALLHLTDMCEELVGHKLYELDTAQTYTLEQFTDYQHDRRQTTAARLAQFTDSVQTLAQQSCDTALSTFLAQSGFSISNAKSVAEREFLGIEAGDGEGDHSITFTERAAMRSQCRKLTRFLRLLDFVVSDSLVDLALVSASDFLLYIRETRDAISLQNERQQQLLQEAEAATNAANAAQAALDEQHSDPRATAQMSPRDRHIAQKKLQQQQAHVQHLQTAAATAQAAATANMVSERVLPLFEVEMQVDELADVASDSDTTGSGMDAHLTFAPPASQFVSRVESILYDSLQVVTQPTRLITMPCFERFVAPCIDEAGPLGDGLDLEMIVLEDQGFRVTLAGIMALLNEAFAEATTYSECFEPFKKAYVENLRFVASCSPENYNDVTLEQLRSIVRDYEAQAEVFSRMVTLRDIAIIRVDSVRLCGIFQPSPGLCMEALHELIPIIFANKSAQLLAEMVEVNEKISEVPYTVDGFVALMGLLEETNKGAHLLDSRYVFFVDMFALMEEFKIPISEENQSAHFVLNQTHRQLKMSIQFAEDSVEENSQRFSQMLDRNIPELHQQVEVMAAALSRPMLDEPESSVPEVLAHLADCEEKVAELSALATKYEHQQRTLNVHVMTYEDLEQVQLDLRLKAGLWRGVQAWTTLTESWREMPISSMDVEEVDEKIRRYYKLVMESERGLPHNLVVPQLRARVQEFRLTLPVVSDLRCASLRDRHWEAINEAVGFDLRGTPDLPLGQLLELRAMDSAKLINVLAVEAVQEAVLVDMLDKVAQAWSGLCFELLPYKDLKEPILGSVDDIVATLEDSLVSINTILASRYVNAIRAEVDDWNQRLVMFQETLDEWILCQRNWMYLENIFSAGEMQRQLVTEYAMFFEVDTAWKNIMRRTQDAPNCLVAGTVPDLLAVFEGLNATLDKVQKLLEDHLETKRVAFPRFYFLSNDELLAILAQTRDAHAVQPHLRKCFDALVALEFGEGNSLDIIAMKSGEGERVLLGRHLKVRGFVEEWLKGVETNMVSTLQRLMRAALQDYEEKPREEWVLSHPAQCVATVAQIVWSAGCEACLRADGPGATPAALSHWHTKNVEQLAALAALVRGHLTPLQRKVVVALVTTDVHARDIVEKLKHERVESTSNFLWQAQLRYYWDKEADDVRVWQSNSVIPYGYEYMGACSRLVITPLTDRCWLTITGAFDLKLGASPAGPAGTGKTESSKDLAKALAIQCIVFNCSDQIDYKMIGKLFSGLAQCGVWTCLDEFNRIDIEVLSVIAQQLNVLRAARLQDQAVVSFEGKDMRLKEHHVIVTMNPGYAGRTELPDNLKVCFRPVAMMVPDYALIAEIMLFAEGFDDARSLSRKMTKLYKLSSEQLSQQPHYDFGMRAVKSVLVMAGALKRENPALAEDAVLIRAMRNANIPKFLGEDVPLFQAIVSDLFPGVVVPSSTHDALDAALRQCMATQHLQPTEGFMTKIIQLYETFNVRFGVALVGPTGAGKSTIHGLLREALCSLSAAGSLDPAHLAVQATILNPKSISMGELYGEVNSVTQEWTDGLASALMRAAVGDVSLRNNWTVFDGPIDALWIENMNTVLDDNMTLCLANGERIKLRENMRMLFEVMDLAVASPATVSRLGVVYVTAEDLGWEPFLATWRAHSAPTFLSLEAMQRLDLTIDLLLAPGIAFVSDKCDEPIGTVPIARASAMCQLIEALFDDAKEILSTLAAAEQSRLTEKLAVFAFVWSVGASISSEFIPAFDEFTRRLLEERRIDLPLRGTVFDFQVDLEQDSFVPWTSKVPAFEVDLSLPFFELVIPTSDTVRYSFVFRALLTRMRPIFVTGVTGTGKTVTVSALIKQLPDVQPLQINFSAQTSSLITQSTIESTLEKKRKTLLGAPAGKQIVMFVDDVNMPAVEQYGAQPPIELLRQLLDQGGMYDRQKLFWKSVVDTVMVAAAAPPGGGRSEVSPRFTRQFAMFCVPPASDATLTHIFGTIITSHLQRFSHTCKPLGPAIVQSTIDIYKSISESLLPTPTKCHYTFNLRDVSKVIQGVLMIKPRSCSNSDMLVRLWVHEAMRVFHDRLTCDEDKLWFTQRVAELLMGNFKVTQSHADVFEKGSPIMFGDFFKPGVEQPAYEEARELSKVATLLGEYLEEYNLSHKGQMNLVFFEDAICHVSRIARILRQPRGNAMLVGVGGSGKQSLTKLACAISEYHCHQIELSRNFGIGEFREELRQLMYMAGRDGQETVFLFTDTQIVDEGFLEDINNILNSGEVPNLFPADEWEQLMSDMRQVLTELEVPVSRDACKEVFVRRVRDKLHIVLCMSPVGDAFRVRLRNFPSLTNCSTIDWYSAWPAAALHSVASRFLGEADLPAEDAAALCDMCVCVHTSVDAMTERFWLELRRKTYVTPKSYLDMIAVYMDLLDEKRTELDNNCKRLSNGVIKLEDTNAMVEGLKAELTKLQPELVLKAEEAEGLLKAVSVDQAEANQVRERVSRDEAEVKVQAEEVSAVQADAQRDLDRALPALNNAIEALNSLDKKDITEVRSYAQPPSAVRIVMEAVCILLGEKTDWDTAKRVLTRSTFMDELKGYDKDNISQKILHKLKRYVEDPLFSADEVRKVSLAATSMCLWVHAMDVYSAVAKDVEPKRARLQEMNAQLAEANAVLQAKQAELKAVEDRVQILQTKCEATMQEKRHLTEEAERTTNRLLRAEKLTLGLKDEHVRWKASVEQIRAATVNLAGDVFLAAACISYLGAFTGVYRQSLIDQWVTTIGEKGITCSEGFELRKVVCDDMRISEWQAQSLPTDSVSTDNAIFVTRGKRWPLMIDPQGQANRWIRAFEADSNLEVVRAQDDNILRVLEKCIRSGRPMLIEDLTERLDPSLEPILQRQTFKSGGRTLVRLGDQDIDYDEAFRLYMTTGMPNPHLLPEVCIKVTVINFTVTFEGLQEQLLGEVVKSERPAVEERRQQLVVSISSDKKQLSLVEDRILKMLSESGDDILDDDTMIDALTESKVTATAIADRLLESAQTEQEINATREQYRAVARRGSILYFVVADLAHVDPMYQYSLQYFIALFTNCLADLVKSNEEEVELETQLLQLVERPTEVIFNNICRGLFEQHKLIFAFLVSHEVQAHLDAVTAPEWLLLLGGAGVVADRSQQPDNPNPAVVSTSNWDTMVALEAITPALEGLCDHMGNNWTAWDRWLSHQQPHLSPLPNPWEGKLSDFQLLVVLRVLCEEKLVFGIRHLVEETLGKQYVSYSAPIMADVAADLTAATPCIFVLSPGADPHGMLMRYVEEKDYADRLHQISLGQGQGQRAAHVIQAATGTGDWVLLQNCHLAKSWLPDLELIVHSLVERQEDGTLSPDFRLFLTSAPAAYFPVYLLQSSVKVTNEPPRGLKANLARTFDMTVSQDMLDSVPGADANRVWHKLLFGLSLFHAVVQERRKFGPLGWNIRYEFNDSDLETATAVLSRFLIEQEDVPWDALRFVTGHINYGGRVTDDWDRRCLLCILGQFYQPAVLDDEFRLTEMNRAYALPSYGSLESYVEFINGLPEQDDAAVFGMHDNANIKVQRQETAVLLATVLALQPRDAAAAGAETPDVKVTNTAEDILSRMPAKLSLATAVAGLFDVSEESGLMSSLAVVLGQEVTKFNRLLETMATTLQALKDAIRGLVVMSQDLDLIYDSFLRNQVPAAWMDVGFASLKPLASWVQDLQFRVSFMREWLSQGHPKAFPLPLFFFPQGFLTGVLQNHARKYSTPVNDLDFKFQVLSNQTVETLSAAPEDGVYVYGLFLEGARWNVTRNVLEDSWPGEMYSSVPPIHFLPASSGHGVVVGKTYSCPTYKTSVRKGVLSTTGISTNLILAIDLPASQHSDYWVRKGVAFICNLNE